MEACGACVPEPSKMDPYAMGLIFALIISTGEIYAFYAQFYGRRKRRGGFVCVHDLKENNCSYRPDKENYNLLKKEVLFAPLFIILLLLKL